jgi:hypothetical protein
MAAANRPSRAPARRRFRAGGRDDHRARATNRRDRRKLRRRLGDAAQDIALDPEMTGAETLTLFAALRACGADFPAFDASS